MVSHNHLLEGNSLSRPSRDIHAEFGASAPNSPNMAESVPNPLALVPISDDSSSNGDMGALSLDCESDLQDVFRAARYFTQKDRVEDVMWMSERKIKF